ncbi:lipocalin-15 [Tamandua tetradactyla]|uniref:lipocalin-15 n=1 Tax=Tamandua tetradactyla TaxID=48850 RepID=UPI004053D98B
MGMLCPLLALSLVLLWAPAALADVLVQPNFDAEKFSGLWYVVAIASNCKVFLGQKEHLLMSTVAVQPTANGSLHFHMEVPWANGCHQQEAEYLKVSSEGHFRAPDLGYLDVRVVATDYGSFAVIYIYKELEGVLSTMVQLYSRAQVVSPKAMEAFRDFYPTLELPHDMAVVLPKSDACSKGAQETP